MVEFLSRSIRRLFVLPSVALALALAPALTSTAEAASPVGLGTASTYALLAGSTITNTGATTVNGDIGLCCTGLATPGFDTLTQTGGAQTAGPGRLPRPRRTISTSPTTTRPAGRSRPRWASTSRCPAPPRTRSDPASTVDRARGRCRSSPA